MMTAKLPQIDKEALNAAMSKLSGSMQRGRETGWNKANLEEATKDLFVSAYNIAAAKGSDQLKAFRSRFVQAWLFGFRIGRMVGLLDGEARQLGRFCLVFSGAMGADRMLSEVHSRLGSKAPQWSDVEAAYHQSQQEAEAIEDLVIVFVQGTSNQFL